MFHLFLNDTFHSSSEAVLKNNDECMKTGNAFCVCNREKWRYGEDPNICKLADPTLKYQVMKEGMELIQNGE